MGDSFTYTTREIETTEWEDILLKKKIITEREEVAEQRKSKQEIASRGFENFNAPKQTAEDVLEEHHGIASDIPSSKMDSLQDSVRTDEDVLQRIRQMRIDEMKRSIKEEVYGDLHPIYREEFIKEVSEASKVPITETYPYSYQTFKNTGEDPIRGQWVVVELFKDGVQASSLLAQLLRKLADKQRSTKFIRIRSTECIENWPDERVPTIFLYFGGELRHTIIGLSHFGGASNAKAEKIEWVLSKEYNVFKCRFPDSENPFNAAGSTKQINVNVESSHVKWSNDLDRSDSEEEEHSEDDDGW